MIVLLDVNVLVALFDPDHVHHEPAHAWFQSSREDGWASCPITENGFLRVVSNPAYPGRRTSVADALERLRRFQASGAHRFWPDSITFCDAGVIDLVRLSGHAHLTDAYLLALAVANDGCLATFDRGISTRVVPGATPLNLVLIAGGG